MLSEAAGNLLSAAVASGESAGQAALLTQLVRSPGFDDADYRACERALSAAAVPAEALLHFGTALLASGRASAALRAFEQAIDADPDHWPAYLAAGALLFRQRAFARARDHLLEAVAIAPDDVEAQNLLGVVLRAMGRPQEALDCFRRASELDARAAHPCYNAGLASRDIGLDHLAGAIAWTRKAVDRDPQGFPAVNYLAGLLSEEGRWREALEQSGRALALRPDDAAAWWRRCFQQLPVVYASAAEVPERREAYAASLRALSDFLERNPPTTAQEIENLVGLDGPFNLAYQARNDRALQQSYGTMIHRLMLRWQQLSGSGAAALPDHGLRRKAGGRIRFGVVSQFIRHHSVWHANIRGFAAHLPRDRFEVRVYDLRGTEAGADSPEAALFDERVSGNFTLGEWVARIECDRPDVLYYPDTCMDAMALGLAARRLAPLQLAGWGHPETTGLPTIDHYLSGELIEPPDGDAHYVEKLLRLPGLGCCYVPVGARPSRVDLPGLGIPADGGVRYLCCQSVFKYLPQHDSVFPRIAAAVGRCHFVFVNDKVAYRAAAFRDRISAAFAAYGLDAARHCAFIDALPLPQFLDLIRQSDVYLDTIGFSGFSTAMMALEQGCPIVTVEGEFMRGRLASGALRRIGVADGIAADADGYVRIAAALGTDASARGRLAARIRRNVQLALDDREPVAALADWLEARFA